MRWFNIMRSKPKPDKSQQLIQEMLDRKQAEAPDEAARLIQSMVKRKEVFGEEFVAQKDYKVLYQSEDREIRLYLPHKRTITINNKVIDRENDRYIYRKSSYFVQLPYLIFAYVKKPHRRLVAELDGNGRPIDARGLYLAFAKEEEITDKTLVYMPTLPNSHHDFKICQGSAGGFDFDNRIKNYWTSEFLPSEIPNGIHALQRAFQTLKSRYTSGDATETSMENWASTDLQTVLERFNDAAHTFNQTKFGWGLLWDGEKLYEKPPFSEADKVKILEAEGNLGTVVEKMAYFKRLIDETKDEDERDWLLQRYYSLDQQYWSELERNKEEKSNTGWYYYSNDRENEW